MAALRPIGADAQDSTSDAHDSTLDAHESTSDAHDCTSDEHEHEHEHEHEPPVPKPRFVPGSFPHEKLDAYRIALQMAALAEKIAASIPRGHRNVADHLERAASNAVLLLAEGANRRGNGEKRQRFVESQGETGEVAAAADLVIVLRLGSADDAEELKQLASRVSAMLTRLILRLR
jgi:four helix bundle protein